MDEKQTPVHTWTIERSPRTHFSEPRRTSHPPTSITALTRQMAANLPSRLRPSRRVVMLVFNLWTSSAPSGALSLSFWSWGADNGTLQRRMWLTRDGSECGSCAGGVDVSFRQRTRRSGGREEEEEDMIVFRPGIIGACESCSAINQRWATTRRALNYGAGLVSLKCSCMAQNMR